MPNQNLKCINCNKQKILIEVPYAYFKKRTENWSDKLDNSLYGWKSLSLWVDSIIKKKKMKKNIYTYIKYKIKIKLKKKFFCSI